MTIDRTTALRLMDAAIEQAEKGWSEGGIPIGSVLARADGTIVARGHNQRVPGMPSATSAACAAIL